MSKAATDAYWKFGILSVNEARKTMGMNYMEFRDDDFRLEPIPANPDAVVQPFYLSKPFEFGVFRPSIGIKFPDAPVFASIPNYDEPVHKVKDHYTLYPRMIRSAFLWAAVVTAIVRMLTFFVFNL